MKPHTTKPSPSFSDYWTGFKVKLQGVSTLSELTEPRRRRLIRTTAGLTYKVTNGCLIPHYYNQEPQQATQYKHCHKIARHR